MRRIIRNCSLFIGQLPFLTHGLHNVSGLQPIVKYVGNLAGAHDLDHSLGPVQKAQFAAYKAHVQSEYGDLLVSRAAMFDIECLTTVCYRRI